MSVLTRIITAEITIVQKDANEDYSNVKSKEATKIVAEALIKHGMDADDVTITNIQDNFMPEQQKEGAADEV